MKYNYFLFLFLSIILISCQKAKQNQEQTIVKTDAVKTVLSDPAANSDSIRQLEEKDEQNALHKYDLTTYPKAKYKIFFGESFGYDSFEHRYGYVIMVIDSTIYLRFHSPENENHHAQKYEKSYKLSGAQFHRLDSVLTLCKLRNKKPKVGISGATDIATYRLIIHTKKVKMDGRVEWGTIFGDASTAQTEINRQIREDKIESSSIGGNYELFISELEKLFPKLYSLKWK